MSATTDAIDKLADSVSIEYGVDQYWQQGEDIVELEQEEI